MLSCSSADVLVAASFYSVLFFLFRRCLQRCFYLSREFQTLCVGCTAPPRLFFSCLGKSVLVRQSLFRGHCDRTGTGLPTPSKPVPVGPHFGLDRRGLSFSRTLSMTLQNPTKRLVRQRPGGGRKRTKPLGNAAGAQRRGKKSHLRGRRRQAGGEAVLHRRIRLPSPLPPDSREGGRGASCKRFVVLGSSSRPPSAPFAAHGPPPAARIEQVARHSPRARHAVLPARLRDPRQPCPIRAPDGLIRDASRPGRRLAVSFPTRRRTSRA